MVDRLSILSTDRPIVEDDGSLTSQSREFFRALWVQSLIIDSGNPEGVVVAEAGSMYMDRVGTSGNILYIKRDDNIGADKSKGWILV